jgi:hypothetical protein
MPMKNGVKMSLNKKIVTALFYHAMLMTTFRAPARSLP